MKIITNNDHFSTIDIQEGMMLLVDKPYRWTSFDVVRKLKSAFKIHRLKIGHAGTLDPLATGLLQICTGKATKQIDSIMAQEKEYTGTICLGATTESYDLEKPILETFDLSKITEEKIRAIVPKFIGEIEQIPPHHSAIKINGERAFTIARRGDVPDIKKRTITIKELELTEIAIPNVKFRVVCSKGTYIRTLAADFGTELNNGAHLTQLTRTRNGNFLLSDAWQMDELLEKIKWVQQNSN